MVFKLPVFTLPTELFASFIKANNTLTKTHVQIRPARSRVRQNRDHRSRVRQNRDHRSRVRRRDLRSPVHSRPGPSRTRLVPADRTVLRKVFLQKVKPKSKTHSDSLLKPLQNATHIHQYVYNAIDTTFLRRILPSQAAANVQCWMRK